jgi:uncharacterized membrane protein
MTPRFHLGNRLAPVRFLAFLAVTIVAAPLLSSLLGWRHGVMAGFDCGALVFLVSLVPLVRCAHADEMRAYATRNDANRGLMLAIAIFVSLAVLVAVGSELAEKGSPKPAAVILIVATLALAWLFANLVYALHYAHFFYTQDDTDGDGTVEDLAGLDFPDTKEPTYWDFIYFSFTLGMTFQTSDVEMTNMEMRRTAIFQCLAAFVFNLGVLAFTINVLGSGG